MSPTHFLAFKTIWIPVYFHPAVLLQTRGRTAGGGWDVWHAKLYTTTRRSRCWEGRLGWRLLKCRRLALRFTALLLPQCSFSLTVLGKTHQLCLIWPVSQVWSPSPPGRPILVICTHTYSVCATGATQKSLLWGMGGQGRQAKEKTLLGCSLGHGTGSERVLRAVTMLAGDHSCPSSGPGQGSQGGLLSPGPYQLWYSFPLPGHTSSLPYVDPQHRSQDFASPAEKLGGISLVAIVLPVACGGFADTPCGILCCSLWKLLVRNLTNWGSRAGKLSVLWKLSPQMLCVSTYLSVHSTSRNKRGEPKQTVAVASRISCPGDFLSLVTAFVISLYVFKAYYLQMFPHSCVIMRTELPSYSSTKTFSIWGIASSSTDDFSFWN